MDATRLYRLREVRSCRYRSQVISSSGEALVVDNGVEEVAGAAVVLLCRCSLIAAEAEGGKRGLWMHVRRNVSGFEVILEPSRERELMLMARVCAANGDVLGRLA
jgi:hypothetical protein